MIEKHELSKNIININDFHSFDFNRIDPRALRDLQNRSEAPPGPPRDLPVARPGPLQDPRDLRRASIRFLAGAQTTTEPEHFVRHRR